MLKALLGTALVFALLTLSGATRAQDAAPAQEKAPSALSAGSASLASGKYSDAVRQLSAALNSESISASEAAKALYQRGLAYRKMGEHARAVADLGAAIWLGLPAQDRLQAQVNRALSYQAVGLQPQAESALAAARNIDKAQADKLMAENGGSVGRAAASTAFTTEVKSSEQAVSETNTAPAPQQSAGLWSRIRSAFGSDTPQAPQPSPETEAVAAFETTVTPEPLAASAPETSAQPRPTRTADISSEWSTSVSDASPAAARAPAPASAAPAAETKANWTTSVSRAREAPAETSAQSQSRLVRLWTSFTGSSDRQAETPPPAGETGSSWSTEVNTKTAASAPAGAGANYRLQLAAARTEDEAKQLWQKVSSENAVLLAGTQPSIQKTDVGTLGTFYRLQIGPFPDKAQSLKVCNTLKQSGVDCFLVTQ